MQLHLALAASALATVSFLTGEIQAQAAWKQTSASETYREPLLYVHIGKSAGSSVGCRLNASVNDPMLVCKNGTVDTVALNSTLSRYVGARIHLQWESWANRFNGFLVILRNPVWRTVSQYYFGMHSKHLQAQPAYSLLYVCYETLGGLVRGLESGLARGQDHKSLPKCIRNALRIVTGRSEEGLHFRFNIQFYAEHMLRLESRRIFVLRTEHLWDDYSRIDSLLGGRGVRPLDVRIRDRNHTSTLQLNSRIRRALCRLLCREIFYYKLLLLESENLNAMEVRQSIDDLEDICPGSSLLPPLMSQRLGQKPQLAKFRSFGVCTYQH